MEPLIFSEEQKKVWRAELAPKATDSQWALFVDECSRRALIPGTHVIFSLRSQSEYDATLQDWVKVNKVAFMTGINALRLIAKRDGNYMGRKAFQFHYREADGKLVSTEIPEGTIPHAVSAEFLRKGWPEPVKIVARFDAFAQRTKKGDLTSMWAKRSEEQLAKCCEAAGLREVAPEECGGLYIKEELEGQDEVPVFEKAAPAAPVAPPQAIVAPAVNQNPAPENSGLSNPAPVAVAPAPEPDTQPAKTSAIPEHSVSQNPPNQGVMTKEIPAKQADTEPAFVPATGTAVPNSGTEPDRLPNTNEFGAFTARASKLMRDVLPKSGIKAPADAFKAYTARVSGQGKALNTKKLTVSQWESLLSAVENATPDSVAKIIKGS